jgi:succinate dehydrogenase flavin-adding protein (antitoxin of CptAB toxin-antitoxin module)
MVNQTLLIPSSALSKLKWRSRRGMLENDLFIERFFNRYGSCLTKDDEAGLYALMDLSDNDLMDLLLSRKGLDDVVIVDLQSSNGLVTSKQVVDVLTKLKEK